MGSVINIEDIQGLSLPETTIDDYDTSDNSEFDSDEEDSRENVLQRMKKIQEKKQELVKRLRLHDAAFKLKASFTAQPKTLTATKRKKVSPTKSRPIPRRKSLRLQKIEARVVVAEDTLEEEVQVPRLPNTVQPIEEFDNDGNKEEISPQSEFQDLFSTFSRQKQNIDVNLNLYVNKLDEMNSIGCCYRKVVDKRIYSIAMHPRNDLLLIAAGSTSGTIGLWKLDQVKGGDEDHGCVLDFQTYLRSVSAMLFSQSKQHLLFFTSFAGVLRSVDIQKMMFKEALIDDGSVSVSSFGFQDQANNVIISGCYDGDIIVSDSRTKSLTTHNAHNRCVKTISVHPVRNHYFATSSNDCLVKIFDFRQLKKTLKPVSVMSNHSKSVNSGYFSPITGNKLLTTSYDDTIRVYDCSDVSSPKMTSSIHHNNNTGRWLSVFKAVWHPAMEDVVAVGSLARPRQIDVYDSKLQPIRAVSDELNLTSVCSLLALHPSRHVIAGGNASGKVFVFESS